MSAEEGTYVPEKGHRVRVTTVVEGVVTEVRRSGYAIDGLFCAAFPANGATRTFERLPDPEPDWQPWDVVLDARGRLFRRGMTQGDGLWGWHYNGGALVSRDYPTRPLTRLVPEVRDGG